MAREEEFRKKGRDRAGELEETGPGPPVQWKKLREPNRRVFGSSSVKDNQGPGGKGKKGERSVCKSRTGWRLKTIHNAGKGSKQREKCDRAAHEKLLTARRREKMGRATKAI